MFISVGIDLSVFFFFLMIFLRFNFTVRMLLPYSTYTYVKILGVYWLRKNVLNIRTKKPIIFQLYIGIYIKKLYLYKQLRPVQKSSINIIMILQVIILLS